MTPQELNQQIAERTGESIQTIRNMGFGPLTTVIPMEEREEPLIIDWDLEHRFRE